VVNRGRYDGRWGALVVLYNTVTGLVYGAAALVAALLIPAAQAQQRSCVPRETAVESLSEIGERVIQRGIAGGHMLELWASSDGGFTIVVTSPDGIACLLAVGDAMHEVPLTTPGNKL
jgi:hypothetical protein